MFTGIIGVFLISCQNSTKPKTEKPATAGTTANAAQPDVAAQTQIKNQAGKLVYEANCLACHQADGSGVPGMHPPLGPGSWSGKEPHELIALMMKGLNGKIEVNGEIYNDFMPSHAQLSDQEIADVLTYVRSSFGNNFSPITPEMVKEARNGK